MAGLECDLVPAHTGVAPAMVRDHVDILLQPCSWFPFFSHQSQHYFYTGV